MYYLPIDGKPAEDCIAGLGRFVFIEHPRNPLPPILTRKLRTFASARKHTLIVLSSIDRSTQVLLGLDGVVATDIFRATPNGSGVNESKMIGWRRGAPKVSTALGVLAPQATEVKKGLTLSAGALAEAKWNKVEAAKAFEASRQKLDLERYRALVRRCY